MKLHPDHRKNSGLSNAAIADIERVYNLFFLPGEVTEVRGLGLQGKNAAWEGYSRDIVAGYFDNPAELAKAALSLDQAGATGTYFIPNPLNPALLARANNRLKVLKNTSQDTDVLSLRWLLLDFDPIRPSGISGTEEEIADAKRVADRVRVWLKQHEFPEGIHGFSGNGEHSLYRLPDLPNDEPSRSLVKRALQAISGKFSTDRVKIDEAVFNPARIWKLYGTTARKGDSTPDRPHRKSYLYSLSVGLESLTPIALKQLVWLAEQAPDITEPKGVKATSCNSVTLDVERYLEHYAIAFRRKEHPTGTLYCLERCIFDPSHTRNESSIVQQPDGKLLYQCFHNSCQGRTWKEAREKISGTDSLEPFSLRPDKSYSSYGCYGSGSNALDIIAPISLPIYVFPECFQSLIRTYATALQIEPELVAIIKMGVLSGAIGNTIRVSVKEGWATTPFLWIAYVAESGYGKSPVQNAILQPVKRLQAKDTNRYSAELKTYDEALRKAKRGDSIQFPEKPRANQKLVADITVEALADVFEHDGRGVIADKDELSGFVLSFNQYKACGGDDRQKWLSLFNCEPLKIDRKGSTRFIKNTGIAIIGGIQPKILPDVFGEKAFEDGLLPRFLLYRAENKSLRFDKQGISEPARKQWEGLIKRCYEIPCEYDEDGFIRPTILTLSDKSLDIWAGFYDEYEQVKLFLTDKERIFIPKLTSYYSLKFAGILHVLKHLSGRTANPSAISEVVAEDVVTGAIALTKYFMWQAVKVLRLYHHPEKRFTEYQVRLIKTLHGLREEVKNGKIPLARIGEAFNANLPEKLQHSPEMLAGLLHAFGLHTDKGTGNYSHLIWEKEKVEKLFSQITVTTVTTVTERNESRLAQVREGAANDDFVNLMSVPFELEG